MSTASSETGPGAGRSNGPGSHPAATDPVSEMRRRLAELGVAEETIPSRTDGWEQRPVRSAEGGSGDQDFAGARSSEPDPQRGRSTGATARSGRSRGRRARFTTDDSRTAAEGGTGGRRGDPVAAGSGRGAERTPQGGTVEQAKDACLRLLAVRARSRAELARRLAEKGYTEEITDLALARLAEVGLIDDAAFAEQWVQSRHTFSGKGRQALAQELRRKGVARSDAEPALEAISSDDETARATELVRRKLRTMPRDLDADKTLRRLVGMLARRGYSSATAFTVVKAELAGIESADEFD